MRGPFKLKVGLALGGGAARGMAHVGVLRGLLRAGIPIDIVVGTSIGAIIGGAYAATGNIEQLERQVRVVLTSEEFRRNKLSFLKETKKQRGGLFFSVANLVRRGIFFGVSNLRPSFLSAEEFATSMGAILPIAEIESLPIPFGAVTLDLESGEEVVLCRGNLREAARASSAIPGILPPVRMNGRLLIDGGWVDKIPVLPLFKLGADLVIAVDINADLEAGKEYNRGVDIMIRANALKDDALVGFSRRMSNAVIEPDVGQVHWADFSAFDMCIRRGDEAATALAPQIKDLMRQERLLSLVRNVPGKRMADLHLQAAGAKLKVVQ